MCLELLKVVVPVLLAGVPFVILARQIRQQNRLERVKVEVEYLRRVLDVLDLPVRTLAQVQTRADETIVAQAWDGLSLDETKQRFRQIAADWDAALEKHGAAVYVAMSFAHEHGERELGESLAEANRASHELGASVRRALEPMLNLDSKDILPGKEIVDRPEMQRAIQAWQRAAGLVVRRIRRLYV